MTGLVALILLMIGVAAALMGDWVGRQAGKRRWSLFHLRPKHTGRLLTVLCGALLAALTAIPLTVALRGWQQVDLQMPLAKDSLKHAQHRIQQLEMRQAPPHIARTVPVATAITPLRPSAPPVAIKPAQPVAPPQWLLKQGDLLMEAAMRGNQSTPTARLAVQEILAMVERHGRKLGSGPLQVAPQDVQRATQALTAPGTYTIQVATSQNVAGQDRLGVSIQIVAQAPAWGEWMEKDRLARPELDSKETLDHLSKQTQRATASPSGSDLSTVITTLPEEPKQVRLVLEGDQRGPIRATVEVE